MYVAAALANSATINPDSQNYFITLYIAGWVIILFSSASELKKDMLWRCDETPMETFHLGIATIQRNITSCLNRHCD